MHSDGGGRPSVRKLRRAARKPEDVHRLEHTAPGMRVWIRVKVYNDHLAGAVMVRAIDAHGNESRPLLLPPALPVKGVEE